MNTHKLSISLTQQQCEFSEVIKNTLYLLQQAQLEAYYRHANQEADNIFEIAISDGLEENEACFGKDK